jgi:hypothetical protein
MPRALLRAPIVGCEVLLGTGHAPQDALAPFGPRCWVQMPASCRHVRPGDALDASRTRRVERRGRLVERLVMAPWAPFSLDRTYVRYTRCVFTSAVGHRYGTERAWTEHLATTVGAVALLEAVGNALLPEHLLATVDEIVGALIAETITDEAGTPLPQPTHHVTHQLHLRGRFPDVAINDVRDRLFAVVEAQRRCADDQHIAKLAAHYVPNSGARLGILVAERWDRSGARHPAWAVCPAPVVVLLAIDALHEVDYRVAWVHHPTTVDTG